MSEITFPVPRGQVPPRPAPDGGPMAGPMSDEVVAMLARRNDEKRLAAIRRLGGAWVLAPRPIQRITTRRILG